MHRFRPLDPAKDAVGEGQPEGREENPEEHQKRAHREKVQRANDPNDDAAENEVKIFHGGRTQERDT